MAWFRFALTAFFLALSVFSFATAVFGVSQFRFVMNRVHAAGIGDTLGLGAVVLGVMLGSGEAAVAAKLLLVVVFMWCTSPVTTHFIGQIEYHMNRSLSKYVKREDLHEPDGTL